MSLTEANLNVRDMRTLDLSDVVQIEQTAQESPWARLSFEESLTKGKLCRVIDLNGEIVAYHVSSVVLDELHILNVVCAPKHQGLGFGHAMMHDIISYAEKQGLIKIFLEVRASNEVAQSLYEKWGFRQIAHRKAYYRAPSKDHAREDAKVYLRERRGSM